MFYLHYNLGHYVNNDRKWKLIFMLQTYSNNLLLKRGTTEVLDDDVAGNLNGNAIRVSKFEKQFW